MTDPDDDLDGLGHYLLAEMERALDAADGAEPEEESPGDG